MCGIAGYVNYNDAPADAELVRRMIDTIAHRGPDDRGVCVFNRAALGHARLSIIDLQGGAQPMTNEDGTLWITFNGEIFNYPELREKAIARGHRFATQSDTEVILHLYEDEGEECVHSLNGQWAFAIWDVRRSRLFLSRDRMGVRPLFYARTASRFLFGSEIKAVFADREVPREIDRQALSDVFTYWCTLPPRTVFRDVHELPPGHSLVLEGRDVSVRRYWDLSFSGNAEPLDAAGEQRSADTLLSHLISATKLRLRADVPVGAYLSGGLDSTVTAALIRQFGPSHLKTFSVAFEDPEFDESRFQQEAVTYLGTEHHQVRCTADDIGAIFPEVIRHAEKPVLRTAPAPLFLLSRAVRQHGYKVVLTGEGADEVLGGYDIFKEAKIRAFCAAHPESRLRPLLLKRLYPYLPNVQAQPGAYMREFFSSNGNGPDSPFFSHLPRWRMTSGLKLFLTDAVREADSGRDHDAVRQLLPARFDSWHPFEKAQYLEAAYLLPGYILSSQGDRMAMANAVEGRFPFLDHNVVEFACTLPPALKMKVLNEKYLLKRCVNGLVPRGVKARHKQPYRAPEGVSFFTAPARRWAEDILSEAAVRRAGLFRPSAVSKLVAKFRSGLATGMRDNMALAGIVSTQLITEEFILGGSKAV
jgi:asparagine synthase (glutamine-hydrolysing)